MPKLLFRGTSIRFIDLRYDDKSKSTYCKINLTAAFSEPVREAMQWGEPPAGFASAKLDGDFPATHLILTPNGKELKQHEIQITAKEIGNFELHRVKNEGGDSTSNELRFQVVTADPEAAAKLREYIANIGKGEAQLRVNYEEQEEMELEEDPEETRLISEEQAADTVADDEPTLATAAAMGRGKRK
jgi:hypothetical protein